MASFSNQDFGSESEEDDFNPAPAIDSDDEGDVKPEEEATPAKLNSEPASRPIPREDYDDDDEEIKPALVNGAEDGAEPDGDGDEELDGEANADGDEGAPRRGNRDDDDEEDEDDEDDDEDEDEEGDVQVGQCLHEIIPRAACLIYFRAAIAAREESGTHATSSLTSKPRWTTKMKMWMTKTKGRLWETSSQTHIQMI